MRHGHFELSFPLRVFIGQYPWLFFNLYGLVPKNRELLVTSATNLVIEGFPRSANSYAVVAFRYMQSFADLKIAHHMHVSAQLILAKRYQIPALLVIRNPEDAVISLSIRDPRISLKQGLESYISFHKSVLAVKDHYLTVDFKEVIDDYSNVVRKVNSKFGTEFHHFALSDKDQEAIFERINRFELGDESRVSRPSDNRKLMKDSLKGTIRSSHRLTKLLREAEKLYASF